MIGASTSSSTAFNPSASNCNSTPACRANSASASFSGMSLAFNETGRAKISSAVGGRFAAESSFGFGASFGCGGGGGIGSFITKMPAGISSVKSASVNSGLGFQSVNVVSFFQASGAASFFAACSRVGFRLVYVPFLGNHRPVSLRAARS